MLKCQLVQHGNTIPDMCGVLDTKTQSGLYNRKHLLTLRRNFHSENVFLFVAGRLRNQLTCWTKPSNCDADLSLLDAEENNGADRTTTLDDRWIVRIAVMDRTATSRTIPQQIQSVTHHSVSAHTILSRLQQSGMSTRHPLLRLVLTGNHERLCCQWCDEWLTWTTEWNNIVFTDESRFCLQRHNGRIRVWRHRGERLPNCFVMHRHTSPALGFMV
ncbi:transposable element Tcb1 transposase [Trichonephila clavipes]|nr:transposable element Tcb1 transposase [Trichonephila clavipes]